MPSLNDPLMIDEPAKFHEGQEVEVELSKFGWHKAKIIQNPGTLYEVEFEDGRRGVFDGSCIRPAGRIEA
jgi:hypothetical protein